MYQCKIVVTIHLDILCGGWDVEWWNDLRRPTYNVAEADWLVHLR